MFSTLKRHASILVTAAVVAAVTASAPALARAGYDAANAHRVDGKHAVGAAASIANRAGKLVATNSRGRLPNNIISTAPNSVRLHGLTVRQLRTQWLTVLADGTVGGSSPAAAHLVVTHPATGTYCVSLKDIIRQSVSGNIQSQVNGFEDITMTITSYYNTSACPSNIRIYTAKAGVLNDSPFTLTFAFTKP